MKKFVCMVLYTELFYAIAPTLISYCFAIPTSFYILYYLLKY